MKIKGIEVDELVKATRETVDMLIMAIAHAQLEREAADERHATILQESEYFTAGKYEPVKRVTDPKDSWLMGDVDAARYFAECDAANKEAGHDLEPGFCPALIAEHEQVKAEWALIEAAYPFLGVENNQLLFNGLDTRAEYLDLLIKLVVNAPGYPLTGRAA